MISVIIIPVSSDPFNLETVESKAKKIQKIEYLKNEKSFLNKIKAFFIIFSMFSFDKIYKKRTQALNLDTRG